MEHQAIWTLTFIILLIVMCEVGGQSCSNMLRHTKDSRYLIIGTLLYGCIVYLLAKAHTMTSMAVVNSIWSGLSVIAISIAGFIFFGEVLSWQDVLAMSGIMLGVMYLSLKAEYKPG